VPAPPAPAATPVAPAPPAPAPVAAAPAPAPEQATAPVVAANLQPSAPKTTAPESIPKPVVNASLPAGGPRKPASMSENSDDLSALLNIKPPMPYTPSGKIDPFEPLVKDESPQAPTTTIKPVKRERNSPLEKIDLGQLKLVAIIASGSGNRALVEETSGKGYVLKEGTFIGLNSGKVVGIALDKVLIEEEYEDAYGKPIIKKKEITLPKPPGE
jgi:type IV pilus assembly protein PilP